MFDIFQVGLDSVFMFFVKILISLFRLRILSNVILTFYSVISEITNWTRYRRRYALVDLIS